VFVIRDDVVMTVMQEDGRHSHARVMARKAEKPARAAGRVRKSTGVGEEAALAIAAARGGTQVYIPPGAAQRPLAVQAHWHGSGPRPCRRADHGHQGLRLELPLGPTGHAAQMRARVDAMIKAGASERDIAMATRYTIRAIRRRRASLATDGEDASRQLSCSDVILGRPGQMSGALLLPARPQTPL
jgi:hypothetical protein